MVSTASWAPCHNVKPLQTISMRRASWTGVSRFMSANRTLRATRAPAASVPARVLKPSWKGKQAFWSWEEYSCAGVRPTSRRSTSPTTSARTRPLGLRSATIRMTRMAARMGPGTSARASLSECRSVYSPPHGQVGCAGAHWWLHMGLQRSPGGHGGGTRGRNAAATQASLPRAARTGLAVCSLGPAARAASRGCRAREARKQGHAQQRTARPSERALMPGLHEPPRQYGQRGQHRVQARSSEEGWPSPIAHRCSSSAGGTRLWPAAQWSSMRAAK